jgi:hypothetical protein
MGWNPWLHVFNLIATATQTPRQRAARSSLDVLDLVLDLNDASSGKLFRHR